MTTVSLRAVAAAAIWLPRFSLTLRMKTLSGPGVSETDHATSTSIARGCDLPCLVMRP